MATEVYLLKSNTHYAARLGSSNRCLEPILSKNQFPNVLDKFEGTDPFMSVNFGGVNSNSGYCQLGASLSYYSQMPVSMSFEGEKVNDSLYRYKAGLNCRGKFCGEKIFETRRPIQMQNTNASISEIDLEKACCAESEVAAFESFLPFKLLSHDRLVSFTDPKGSGYCESSTTVAFDMESLAFMKIFNRLRNHYSLADNKPYPHKTQFRNLIYMFSSCFSYCKERIKHKENMEKDQEGRKLKLEEYCGIEKTRFEILAHTINAKLLLNIHKDRIQQLIKRREKSKRIRSEQMLVGIMRFFELVKMVSQFDYEGSKQDTGIIEEYIIRISKLEFEDPAMQRILNFVNDVCKNIHELDSTIINECMKFASKETVDRCTAMRENSQVNPVKCIWRATGSMDYYMSKFTNSLISDHCSWICVPKANGSFMMKKSKFTNALSVKNYVLAFYTNQIQVFGYHDTNPRAVRKLDSSIDCFKLVGVDHKHKNIFAFVRNVPITTQAVKLVKISFDKLLDGSTDQIEPKTIFGFPHSFRLETDIYENTITVFSTQDQRNQLTIIETSDEKDQIVKSVDLIDLFEEIEDTVLMRALEKSTNFYSGYRNIISNRKEVMFKAYIYLGTPAKRKDYLVVINLEEKCKPFLHEMNLENGYDVVGPVFRHKKTLMHFGLHRNTLHYTIIAFTRGTFTTLIPFGKDKILLRKVQTFKQGNNNRLLWRWIDGSNRLVLWSTRREKVETEGEEKNSADDRILYRVVLRMKSFRLRLN
jgi:hypothetical protein